MSFFVDVIISGLSIFVLRVIDVALGTIRALLVNQGRQHRAAFVGFFEMLVFIFAIAEVITHLSNYGLILGFCIGYAVGIHVGIWLEEKISAIYSEIKITSKSQAHLILDALRTKGLGVTTINGEGKDGPVTIIYTVVKKKIAKKIITIVDEIDSKAFVTINDAKRMYRGFFNFGGKT